MRELLQEAAKRLREYAEAWKTEYGEDSGTSDDCKLLARIDAALAAPESGIPPMTDKEQWEMRVYLAMNHEDGKCHIYGDDGELQCSNTSRHGRMLDFRRETISALLENIQFTRLREFQETEAAPEPDAEAIAERIEQELCGIEGEPGHESVVLDIPEAAAMIADRGKRVPRAMLEEIYRAGYSTGYVQPTTRNRDKEIAAIAAKYDVKVEG